ncbi:MAG TPA: oxidoreductase, partial [Actinoplanes sp.]|nr:oxidoreductase [Actinoplanes sp.]
MTTEPLAHLLDLADVAPAFAAARDAVDAALRHRALRRHGGPVAAEVGLRAAVASAALEGHDHDLESVRAGTVTDPVLQGAVRVAGALDSLAVRWPTAPRQVLARLHLLAARGAVPDEQLGRLAGDAAVAARLD